MTNLFFPLLGIFFILVFIPGLIKYERDYKKKVEELVRENTLESKSQLKFARLFRIFFYGLYLFISFNILRSFVFG